MGRCHPMPFCEWSRNDWMKVHEFEEKRLLAVKIFYIFIIIFTIFGNILVLVATWREKKLHQPNKYLIACLAVADLLVGSLVIPLRLYRLHLTKTETFAISIHLHRFMFWIETMAITTSVYTMTIISFDRYLKISKSLQYRLRMTTSRLRKIIFVTGLFSASFSTYLTIPRAGSKTSLFVKDKKLLKEIQTALAVVGFFVPTIVMLVMYALIFIVAHKRQKMLRNGNLGQISNPLGQRTALRNDVKVIRMLFLVVGLFILCWGPFFTSWLLALYYPNFPDYDETSVSYWIRLEKINTAIMEILPMFNSMCNPIIYAWLDLTYRKAFKKLFQQMICRRN
ncbi:D(2)-like dopamine receptor [Dendronephthya gigantea]|uniref:D(2)-like dopamine receptor n=1 Tax=Dendronephthya gigantea TaxID=151771 RepID=UPI00106C70ED|nr:D(2)-like dopamine receptor [Dendronephthya gigantea]